VDGVSFTGVGAGVEFGISVSAPQNLAAAVFKAAGVIT
jgi:hypothetical protein